MPDQVSRTLPPVTHEVQDVSLRFITRLLASIGATLLLLVGLAYWIFHDQVADRRFAQPFPEFPSPRLQASPRADMDALRDQQLHALNSAGWQDRAAGTLHTPIEQAMRAVAVEGIGGWPAGNPSVSLGDRR